MPNPEKNGQKREQAAMRTVAVALSTEDARKLIAIPEVVEKINKTRTWSEALKVLAEEAEKHGFKSATLKAK